MDAIVTALNLLGGLAVFLYGLKLMSDSLEEAAGSRMRTLLRTATANRFTATGTGFAVTSVIQSSSATTVMVVAFASAGLLTLSQSLGVIFGANIGTTTTGWLVGLLGFKVKITAFALPVLGIGFFARYLRRWPKVVAFGQVAMGFGLLFLGLALLKDAVPDLRGDPAVVEWIAALADGSWRSRLILVGLGAVLTMVFQSSSAMMAVTLTAATKGLIDYPSACALVLGENIGTTITANIAAVGAPLTARQAARGHLVFNVAGATWAFFLMAPLLGLVDRIVPGDPFGTDEGSLLLALPAHIAAFHTTFNVINTAVMLPLLTPLERFIVWLEPAGQTRASVHHIPSDPETADVWSTALARQEVAHLARTVLRAFRHGYEAIGSRGREFDTLLDRIRKDEALSDDLQHRIIAYLGGVLRRHRTDRDARLLQAIADDLERVGDDAATLGELIARVPRLDVGFTTEATAALRATAEPLLDALDATARWLEDPEAPRPDLPGALARCEALREQALAAHHDRIAEGRCDPEAGVVFVDALSTLLGAMRVLAGTAIPDAPEDERAASA